MIRNLCTSWDRFSERFSLPESEWKRDLQAHLDYIIDLRIEHVRLWLDANTFKFAPNHAHVLDLYRKFDNATIDLKSSVQLCGTQCAECNLTCILGRHHDGQHECRTDHRCVHYCEFERADHGDSEPCGLL